MGPSSSSETLRCLLQDCPEFTLDLAEYIEAAKHTDLILGALAKFTTAITQRDSSNNLLRKLLEVLNAGDIKAVPAYSQTARPVKRLVDLPLITKHALRANPRHYFHPAFSDESLWCKTTTGSTGAPLTMLYDSAAYFVELFTAIPRVALRAGFATALSEPIACLHISDSVAASPRVLCHPDGISGLMLQTHICHDQPETIGRVFSYMATLKPAILSSRPEILLFLITAASQCPVYTPHFVLSSGSALTEEARGAIASFFNCPVFAAYALSEIGLVASECRYRDGLHIDASKVFAEVVDDSGSLVGDPALPGELVLSSIANTAMPLLRYCTGDIATLSSSTCSCGTAGQRILKLLGRMVPLFRFDDGTQLAPTVFNDLPFRFPLSDYRVTQVDANTVEIIVHVNPSDTTADLEHLLSAITAYAETRLPPFVEVLTKVGGTPTTKTQRYRTLLFDGNRPNRPLDSSS